MHISAHDRERITAAIRAAEAKTSGEIVCVLAQASSDATALPVLLAALAALAVPWLLVALTAMTVERMLLLQIAVFLVLMVIFCLPQVRVALMPRRARRAIAHRVAMEQFVTRGVARKADRSGILIFVSFAERYARIIADEGIASRVGNPEWQAIVNTLVAHIRDDRIADGFVMAVDACGRKLAEHFPRVDIGRNELPDRLYLV